VCVCVYTHIYIYIHTHTHPPNGRKVGGVVIPRVKRFRYLSSIIQENRKIDEDTNQRIKIGWQK